MIFGPFWPRFKQPYSDQVGPAGLLARIGLPGLFKNDLDFILSPPIPFLQLTSDGHGDNY
jgi:hypothetical protein